MSRGDPTPGASARAGRNSMTTTNRSGILAGGNWLVDYTKIIDAYPAQDTLVSILAEKSSNGGGPYNVLIDLARLKAPFPLVAVGLVGDDSTGDYIREDCLAHQIDVRQLHVTKEAPTSYTDVMTVKSTGRRTFFHQRGANAFLDATHFDFTQSTARIFHLGYLLLLDRLDQPDATCGTVAASVLRRARESGLKTSVDLVSVDSSRFAEIALPALRFCDYCILNDFEAERTTGIAITREGKIDLSAAQAAARELLRAGVHEWVIIHFPAGAIAAGRQNAELLQPSVKMPQSSIAGTTGAGDAFAAGVLFGLHENAPMKTALNYGVCVAAASLMDPTSSNGVVPLGECLTLADRFGYRELA
jgi:sugar/nucleoside kinase (ribokinase family)